MDEITRADIALCCDNLDVAPKTRKNFHAVLSAALAPAVDEKLIETNPAGGIRAPESSRRRDAVFRPQEKVDDIADTIAPRWSGLTRLLAHSGLRYAEATAWRPVDVATTEGSSTLRIIRAWRRTDNGEQIGTPKSPRSHRHVTFSVKASGRLHEDMTRRGLRDLVHTRAGRPPAQRVVP